MNNVNSKMLEKLKESKPYKNLNIFDRYLMLNEFENSFKLKELEYMELQEKFFEKMARKMDK